MIFNGSTDEYLELDNIDESNSYVLKKVLRSALTVLWFEQDGNKMMIDGKDYLFNKKQLVFLTEFHNVELKSITKLKLLRFNRPFYCILDHDSEVGCKGILFFGSSDLPRMSIPDHEIEKFEIVWKMFLIEMQSEDALQIEMLQMMLKRFLILCTRIYKEQHHIDRIDRSSVDIIRNFNFLVEQHFKTKHTVSDYAGLLNKSPKTISNLFSQLGSKTPLQFIQERIMLEARRLLRYSKKSIKEIAYELGYEDIQSFSRFFKSREGIAPGKFKDAVNGKN